MQSEYITFDFRDAEQPIDHEQTILDFVPDGFEFVSSQRLDTLSVFVYANEAGDWIISATRRCVPRGRC